MLEDAQDVFSGFALVIPQSLLLQADLVIE